MIRDNRAYSRSGISPIVGKRDIGVLGEAQHGGLVLFHAFPQVVCIGLGHFAPLTLLSRGNRWKLALPLGEDGAVALLYGLVFVLAQRLVVALGDFVAGTEEQAFHALGPSVVVGVDDEGELAKEVRAEMLHSTSLGICCGHDYVAESRSGRAGHEDPRYPRNIVF